MNNPQVPTLQLPTQQQLQPYRDELAYLTNTKKPDLENTINSCKAAGNTQSDAYNNAVNEKAGVEARIAELTKYLNEIAALQAQQAMPQGMAQQNVPQNMYAQQNMMQGQNMYSQQPAQAMQPASSNKKTIIIVCSIVGAVILIAAIVLIIVFAAKGSSGLTTAEYQTRASELSNAVKNLYAGVASGVVNSSTPQDELNTLNKANLPAAGSTIAKNKEAANKLTIQDAIDYGGLSAMITDDVISKFVYDTSDCSIYYAETHTGGVPLTRTTTLGKVRGVY